VVHTPWLLDAPPWAAAGEPLARHGTRGAKRRRIDHLTDAEYSLGKLAVDLGARAQAIGWRRMCREVRGRSNFHPHVRSLRHQAARLLDHLRLRGAAVPLATSPWSDSRTAEAMHRGPHKSSHGEKQFVAEEMLDFFQQGYWVIVPYDVARAWPNLRISPLGVIPQRDRRPRLIVDYTFSGLNSETLQWAPREAMQFGRALQRVLKTILHADPRYGAVHMAKIDVADGFYRVWVRLDDVPKLGVALPTAPGCPPLVAFPLALPMGWIESPPYFTAATETICDLANSSLSTSRPLVEPHRLESVAAIGSPPVRPPRVLSAPIVAPVARRPVAAVDVYVDDFLLLAQTRLNQTRVMRATLTAMDSVFRPPDASDPPFRKEPASVKKMLKGEAAWATHKRLLGWDIDSEALTLNLPPHRFDRLLEVLQWISPPRKRLSTAKWHRLLGELRSMSVALPGTRGLFSVLQHALSKGDAKRVRLTPQVYDTAADFTALVQSLGARPTRIPELVPTLPIAVGASDACGRGMGGVWLDASARSPPIVWRSPFPAIVTDALVADHNPKGTLSISDFELAAIVAHVDIIARARDIRERTIWIASDNRAAVSWSNKGSSTSVAARAHLLRLKALHQRQHRYLARHHYIPGAVNSMADDASRLWDLSDSALLAHFDRLYPQDLSWTLLPLTSEISASVIGALCRKRPTTAFPASVPLPLAPAGTSGATFVPSLDATPLPCPPAIPCPCSSCSPNVTAQEPLRPAATLSALAQWRMPYKRWARRTPGWGPLTLV
jgi:hypothetical protein